MSQDVEDFIDVVSTLQIVTARMGLTVLEIKLDNVERFKTLAAIELKDLLVTVPPDSNLERITTIFGVIVR
jgi:hypothetical protein